jgi:dTDP-3-amino-3,4,6-trideoxy-alpha-D-glucopyranose N,N-dimethyltransferase
VEVADQSQFHLLARYYDLVNDWKDYRKESEQLTTLVRRYRSGRTATWLDVACGTGRHLEFLRRHFRVAGLDSSGEMLRIARRRLPGVPLVLGDMRSFRLGRRFDVVSCLFSAIGHLTTKKDVRTTIENFARHLNPGGVAIVEPWIDPSAFRTSSIHLRTHVGRKEIVARLAFSLRRGRRSVIQYHFLIGRSGRGVQYFREEDVGLLLSPDELSDLMKNAGLKPRFLTRGLTPGRGLLVGVKIGAR